MQRCNFKQARNIKKNYAQTIYVQTKLFQSSLEQLMGLRKWEISSLKLSKKDMYIELFFFCLSADVFKILCTAKF